MHTKRIEIRWRDLDGFRHVNHAVFVTYIEECRDELLAATLEGIGDFDEFVIVHLEIDYRRPLTQQDEAIVVGCRLETVGRSSVHTREEVRTLTGDLAANASSVMVPVNATTGSARRLTDTERFAFEASLEPSTSEPGPAS